MTNSSSVESAREWFTRERPSFERFGESVRATIESLISQSGIDYLSVTARVKELESFAEKIERKGYTDPKSQMTDIVGLRVIAYIESDVDRICELIRSAFHIDEKNSLDKMNELGRDRFGYRSVHFVCDLGSNRLSLPENQAYKNYVCEIQVRTVLQHAWAEMHHDRGYKFTATLPSEIERRLFAQAAILEQADREFNRLAQDIDDFAEQVRSKSAAGELDFELTTESLLAFLPRLEPELPGIETSDRSSRTYDQLAEELRGFGVKSVRDLEELMNKNVLAALRKEQTAVSKRLPGYTYNWFGALRTAMMLTDLERYMRDVEFPWTGMHGETFDLLAERHGFDRASSLVTQAGISVHDRDLEASTKQPSRGRKKTPE